MNSSTINRLVQAITVLAVLYALIVFGQSRQTAPGAAVPAGLTGIKTAVDKLAIGTDTDTIELQREGGDWFIRQRAVRPEKSAALLAALEDVDFTRVVSGAGDDDARYGLADGAKSISVYQGTRNLRTIIIGAPAPAPGRFYAKLGGKPAVYEAEGELFSLLGEPITQWIQDKPRTEKK